MVIRYGNASSRGLMDARTWRLGTGLAMLLLILIGGCSQLPDVKPFADATGNLATAVSSAQSQITSVIESSYDPSDSSSKTTAMQRAKEFRTAWAHRVKVVNAFADYAEGLAAVAKSGHEGETAARQVTGQFAQLIDAVKPGYGSEAVVSAVAEAAEKIAGEIIKQQAARTLTEAVTDNQSHVRELADALNQDWSTARNIARAGYDHLKTVSLAQTNADDDNLAGIATARDVARKTLIEGIVKPPATPAEKALVDEAQARLAALDSHYNAVVSAPAYQKAVKDRQQIQDSEIDLYALIDQAELVTTQWAAAHSNLADALRERRSVSFQRLLQLSEEMIEIYKNARKR